jgi:hypothetical protein
VVTPYADAAMTYLSRGWAPLPLPPRDKAEPPKGWTGHGAPWPSGADVTEWAANGHGAGNIGIRMPDDVVGIDVDDYDDKGGGETLAKLEARLGLLPPSPKSTSRPDDPVSGIRFYQVPGGRHWHDPGPGVEVIQHTYRYAVVAPSIHPEGRSYLWLAPDGAQIPGPAVADLPVLPEAWVGDLSVEAMGRHTGRWSELDREALDPRDFAALQALEALGGHGAYQADGYVAITRPGKVAGTSASIGHIGPGLVKVFTPNWSRLENGRVYEVDQLVAFRPPRTEAAPVAGADLWRRPELERIRDFARARMAPPAAVLAVALARVICRTPEWVTLPPLIFSPASLNLAVAIVGESGAGKSGAVRVAAEALQTSGGYNFHTHSIGTGQGLAHAYARYDNKEGVVRTAYSAMLTLDEVAHLAGHARQNGSTILAELRRFLMGEPLGHLYVDLYKRVELPAHSYRGAVIIGVQPAKADAILDDVDAGTPQRFGWFPATDPNAGDDMPDCPEPLAWEAPTWDRRQVAATGGFRHIDICDEAADAIREAHRQRARGEGDALDGHRLLTRERFATGFALLAGHADTEGITADDWALAGALLDVSDRTRAQVVDRLTRARAEQNRQRGEAEAERAAIVGERTADAELKRGCRYITRKLSREADWVNGSPLRASLPGPLRPLFDAAIDVLLEAGQIEMERTAGNYPGSRYRLAERATTS